jgi:hypothetical protein
MMGFLMVRIIRPCIKRAQQRILDACVLDIIRMFRVKAFALTFEGFVPFYLEHSRLHLL